MMAGSHVALGAAAWLVASPHLGLGPAGPAGLLLAVGASLLPDIDHPKSWVGRRTGSLSVALSAMLGHRGVTHSLVAIAVCAWVLLHNGAPRWAAEAAAVGYASHLFGDLLTPAGLRLFWPLRRTFAIPLCRTGSAMEPVVVALLLLWAFAGSPLPVPVRHMWDDLVRQAGRLAMQVIPAATHMM